MAGERDFIEKKVVVKNKTTGRFAGFRKRKIATGPPPNFTEAEIADTTQEPPPLAGKRWGFLRRANRRGPKDESWLD